MILGCSGRDILQPCCQGRCRLKITLIMLVSLLFLTSCDPIPEECAKAEAQSESETEVAEIKPAGCTPVEEEPDEVVTTPPVEGGPVDATLPAGVAVFGNAGLR